MGYERNWVALSAADTSTFTSNAFLVADAATIALSVITTNNVASLVTIEGSNDNGFTGTITNWSVLTTLTAPGLYTIDAGARWHRVRKASLDSGTSVAYQTWNN